MSKFSNVDVEILERFIRQNNSAPFDELSALAATNAPLKFTVVKLALAASTAPNSPNALNAACW